MEALQKLYFDKSISKFRELEIGDLVKWNVGNKTAKGIFRTVSEKGKAEVNSLWIEKNAINLKCEVDLSIIELDY